MKRDPKDVLAILKASIASGDIKVATNEGYRYYTDTLTETLNIPITTSDETLAAYERLVLDKQTAAPVKDLFLTLPRVSMFIGQPDTGKTYLAQKIAKDCGIVPLLKMCRDSLNLETLLEDFKLVDGKPVFEESLAIKMLSGTDRAIIILDEFNTLLTGVMKTLQPIFDDTSTTFEYRGKIYTKNMNCKFIVTLNDKDKGISIVPDAILSRSHLKWFDPVAPTTVARWTNTPDEWVLNLYNIYKALGLLNIFGTRQVKMLRQAGTPEAIRNHLYGLVVMKNLDSKIIDTINIKNMLTKL